MKDIEMGIDYALEGKSKKRQADIDMQTDTAGKHNQPSHSLLCSGRLGSGFDRRANALPLPQL